jgi:UDP-arabinose 4-epimerase
MSTILVTGGAGYIGSHTAKALAQQGHTPVVYDNMSLGNAWAVKWGPLVQGELADTDRLAEALRAHRIDAVLHFAANAYVGESMEKPEKYLRNNVGGTLSLLEAMVAAKVETIVVSSTCASYGIPESLPITEDTPQNPISVYGDTKCMMERMLYWFAQAHGLRYAILRYFNAAGADPDGEIGECHDPEPHLIPIVIQAALGRRPTVQVFGNDYETPDGTCIRDYVHVTDLADAHVRALDYLSRGEEPAVFNLGHGDGQSVLDIIHAVERISGIPVPYEVAPRRPGDPPILVADPRRAREILGWMPRYSDLDTIVGTAWRWHAEGR